MSTAQQAENRELVLCHACDNEWWRDEHGLECPACHCDIVEIITADDDPRNDRSEVPESHSVLARNPEADVDEPTRPSPRNEPPDPDHEDIDHVEFSPAPGIHFQRTFIRTGGVRGGQRQPNDDVVGTLFQAFGGLMQGAQNPNRQSGQPQVRGGIILSQPPQFASRNPMQPPHPPHHHHHHFHGTWPPSVANEPRPEQRTFFPGNANPHGDNTADPMTGIHAMLQTMLASMQPHMNNNGAPPNMRGGPGGPGFGFPEILNSIFNPANAVHGDAAYTQEAFDRIIGQMMEQNNQSSAPGPASESAISSLPKKKIDKTMLGSDGKAECSVCMDNVELGEEVTMLPCHHWFHEMCVTIWLKEHDTCPHCRKGIMPAEGEGSTPRSPGQPPRHNQNPFDRPAPPPPPPPHMPGSPFMQSGMNQPYVPGGFPAYPEPQSFVQPPQQPPRPDQLHPSSSRRRSRHGSGSSRGHGDSDRRHSSSGQSGGSGGGGVTGWFRNLRSSSRNGES